jgi:hypothetical protein
MKDRYAVIILALLFIVPITASLIINSQSYNFDSQNIYGFSGFFVLIIGGTMALIGINRAKKSTDKKMGYGPYFNTFYAWVGAKWYSWPAKYYQRNKNLTNNYLRIKDEFKPKVKAWQDEYRKSKLTNVLFVIGLLLIVVSIILFAASVFSLYNSLSSLEIT